MPALGRLFWLACAVFLGTIFVLSQSAEAKGPKITNKVRCRDGLEQSELLLIKLRTSGLL